METSLYKGKYLELKKTDFAAKNGKKGSWEYVARVNGTFAVAGFCLTDAEELILVRQFRPPVNKQTIELPAGLTDRQGESPEAAVVREVQEETGYIMENPVFVMDAFTTAGMSSEFVRIYFGRISGRGMAMPDETEDIFVYPPVPLIKLRDFTGTEESLGYHVDFKILAALQKVQWLGLI